MLERLVDAIERDPWVWLLCAVGAGWMLLSWGRSRWRAYQGRRRRREFDAREERRWQGHRRDSSHVTRFRRDR